MSPRIKRACTYARGAACTAVAAVFLMGATTSDPKVAKHPAGDRTVQIEDLKAMFVYAPDNRIKEHPVKFGQGGWTSVIGVMEGTFTKPMPTIGHWKNGVSGTIKRS